MPNPGGKNQYGEKEYPSDNDLRAELQQYTRERLTVSHQLARLEAKFNLRIKERKLYTLRKRLGIKTVRKSGLEEVDKAQALVDMKQSDVAGMWGVDQVKQRLANEDVHISRGACRELLHDHFDSEFDNRFNFSKKISRKPLFALGPFHKISWDGHEKLGGQALEMGPVALPIYSGKDEYSAYVLTLSVMPNVRSARAIGHLKLDVIEQMDFRIAITDVTDKGSETGEMGRIQETLRY